MKKLALIRRVIRALNPWRPHWGMMTAWDEHHGYFKISYAQHGEDLVLHALLSNGAHKINWFGFYVDVGAFHPEKYSNTFLFYRQGWRGINIEADPQAMEAFNCNRTRDLNLSLGISNQAGYRDLFIFQAAAYNTFSEEVAKSYQQQGEILVKKESVKTVRLEQVLDEHLPVGQKIDFLSVDVEGLDLEVLESNNWEKYQPLFVLVESHSLDIKQIIDSELYRFMSSQGYKLVSIAAITLIFKKI